MTIPETNFETLKSGILPPGKHTDTRLIQASAVRDMCGDISDMSLWRWLQNPELDFPKPRYIGKRRYWFEIEIIDWLESRPVEAS